MKWALKNNLIFIGYMGCGKTSVGKCLAGKLGTAFLDTDQWIEEQQGCMISTIFSTQVEEAFRNMETDCLRTFLDQEIEGVIAVGGGLPLREENRKLLNRLGKVIYLRVQPETVYERLKADTTRPLLQTADPKETIKEMLKLREAAYMAAADVVVEADRKIPEELAAEIICRVLNGERKKWE